MIRAEFLSCRRCRVALQSELNACDQATPKLRHRLTLTWRSLDHTWNACSHQVANCQMCKRTSTRFQARVLLAMPCCHHLPDARESSHLLVRNSLLSHWTSLLCMSNCYQVVFLRVKLYLEFLLKHCMSSRQKDFAAASCACSSSTKRCCWISR